MDIGERIRFVRQFRGLTQTEFVFHNMRTEPEFHVKTC